MKNLGIASRLLGRDQLADTNDYTRDTDCSLREALDVAVDDDTNTFAPGVVGTIDLVFGRLSTSKVCAGRAASTS